MSEVRGSGAGEGAAEATARRRARSNRNLAAGTAAVVVAMIGLTYAAAPFYTAFCRATGYEGTTQRVNAGASFKGRRTLTVTFDANVAPGLDWRLEPEQDSIRLRTGKTVTVFFRARNLSDKAGDANATYNVAPPVSGGYFDKISCFCFSTQHLSPHQTAEWPVVFYLDPALEKDNSMANVDSVTLSYTLFAAPQPRSPATRSASDRAGPAG